MILLKSTLTGSLKMSSRNKFQPIYLACGGRDLTTWVTVKVLYSHTRCPIPKSTYHCATNALVSKPSTKIGQNDLWWNHVIVIWVLMHPHTIPDTELQPYNSVLQTTPVLPLWSLFQAKVQNGKIVFILFWIFVQLGPRSRQSLSLKVWAKDEG